MALADRPLGQRPPRRRRQAEQPQRIGHRGAALAYPLRELLLGQPVLVQQLPVGGRRLQRPQVLALQVLDQRPLQPLARGGRLLDHRRQRAQPGQPRRPPAPLAGHQHVAAVLAARHHHRLQHPVLAQRVGQYAIARQVAKYNQAPFTITKESRSETQPGWRELLCSDEDGYDVRIYGASS